MPRTATLLLTAALSLAFCGLAAAEPATIVKNPVKVVHREFDYDHQPADMPPLRPPEAAQCQSEIRTDAALDAQGEQSVPDVVVVKIRSVKFTLDCKVTLWLPKGYDKRILDHEEGHRRITEAWYAKADGIARAVCDPYVGKEITVRGNDIQAQLKNELDRLSKEITEKFQARFTVEKTQQRYDAINNHGLKTISVEEAYRQAFAETAPEIVK